MTNEDIRWKQRVQNYEKAFLRLKEAMEREDLNELEKDGLIFQFKITVDLAWSVLRDFLMSRGFNLLQHPNEIFRVAQESRFINNAQILIDASEIRNQISSTDRGAVFLKSKDLLYVEMLPALEQLNFILRNKNT